MSTQYSLDQLALFADAMPNYFAVISPDFFVIYSKNAMEQYKKKIKLHHTIVQNVVVPEKLILCI